jgi:L-threonylcarbamoyladenylate synthase
LPPVIVKINPDHPHSSGIRKAVRCLQRGGVIIYPTETVYGLGGNGECASVVQKIQNLKGRQIGSPFLILVGTKEEAVRLVEGPVSQPAKLLMNRFWPGPLTLIFPASACVPEWIQGPDSTVGVRISSSSFCQSLLRLFRGLLISTSANPAGSRPAETTTEALEYFGESIDLVVDGGGMESITPSTIVDVTESIPVLVRAGAVSADAIRRIAGTIQELDGV